MKVNIIGSGTWGTALAYILYKNNIEVLVWGRDENKILNINNSRIHPNLKDFIIPQNIKYTTTFPSDKNSLTVVATPTNFLGKLKHYIDKETISNIVIASKGFYKHENSYMIASDFLMKTDKKINLCILTGPTHAEEIIKDNATAILAASSNNTFAKNVQRIFSNKFFRVYTSDNIIAAQIGGAIKNVIAIASGICDGLNLGDNTKAALVSRGMSEIADYYNIFYDTSLKDSYTFFGLSGLGDLIATSYSNHSRNRKFGQLVGQGLSVENALLEIGMFVEGFESTAAVKAHCDKKNIDMPICSEIYEILYNKKDPELSLFSLMTRKLTNEN